MKRPAVERPPGSSREGKSAARRAAILQAALGEFCEKGFAATRVEDIAVRADVGKGTIYLNFKDKQALFEELIRSTLGAHIDRLQSRHVNAGQSVRETLESFAIPSIEAARAGRVGELMRLMIAESGRFPHLAEFYYREVVERAMQAIRRLALEAGTRGEMPGDQLVRYPQILAAPLVVALLWSALFERFAPLDARGMVSAFLDLIFGSSPLNRSPKSGKKR